MVLEAERHGCVREVLVIAAALSIQDPRNARPRSASDGRRAAPPLRRRRAPTCCRSSRCGTTSASGSGRCRRTSSASCAGPSTSTTSACGSGRTCSASCARSPATSASVPGSEAGHPDHVHQAVLAGLLSHIGMRDRDSREFRGARGASFTIAGGSVLTRRAAALGDGGRAGRDEPAVGAPRGRDPAGVGRARRRPPRPALVRRAAVGCRSAARP